MKAFIGAIVIVTALLLVTQPGVFDRALQMGGLLDKPAAVDNGRPDVRVWVDLRSALYYCPGAVAYGKVSRGTFGKFETQQEAQQDHLEPAGRVVCK